MNSILLGCLSFLFATTCSAIGLSVSFGGSFSSHTKAHFSATLFPQLNASFTGTVVIEKGRMLLAPAQSHQKLVISPINPEIKLQLSKLKSGDFLSIEGVMDDKQSVLYVNSVNYVGLKDLIGNWVGDDEYCYQFIDFYVMSIYNKNDKNKCDFAINSLAREFSYFINPAYPDWSALLSDNDSSYLMDLTLDSKNSAQLSLYDSQSGDIIRQIRIRR